MNHPSPSDDSITVLHLDPDPVDSVETVTEELETASSAVPELSGKSNKVALLKTVSIYGLVALMFLSLAVESHRVNNKFEEGDQTLESLIDEMGTLREEKFLLSEQVSSQETVLQTLEEDFSTVQDLLQNGKTEDPALKAALDEVNKGLASLPSPQPVDSLSNSLSKPVILASEPDQTKDVLILGTNGAHTDTILLASINDAEQKISLLSIPRDLYINGRRINEYYTYYGVDQLERMVEVVTGLTVDNYAQVDLAGFQAIVDIIGGIDITVEKALYDSMYPNGKGGYAAYSIEPGNYHMNGEEALKYARSRKSTSDFDRAARQQKVLESIHQKILQMDLVMDMKDLTKLFQAIMTYTKTDVDLFTAIGLYYDYKEFDVQPGLVLTSSNYLYSKINESGAYILLPKNNSFDEIHSVISELVN